MKHTEPRDDRETAVELGMQDYKHTPGKERDQFVRALLEKAYDLEEHNLLLRKSNKGLRSKIETLKLGLNKNLLEGTNRHVTIKYATEVLIYLKMLDAAMWQAKNNNEGRQTYPFLFRTDAKRLAKQFKINEKKAQGVLRILREMGVIEFVRRDSKQLPTYKLGEMKKVRRKNSGELSTVHVVASQNLRTSNYKVKKFYEGEKRKMGLKNE